MNELGIPLIGKPLDRVDGRLKVTGGARYADDFPAQNVCYAALVRSAVAHGKITGIDARNAEAAPGVIAVFSHLKPLPLPDSAAFSKEEKNRVSIAMSIRPLGGPEIEYNGQYVAMVVAETFEQATHGASLVKITYDVPVMGEQLADGKAAHTTVELSDELGRAETPKDVREEPPIQSKGNAEAAFQAAEVRLDRTYTTPWETHNPMEPHATTAQWKDDKLLIYDATQSVCNEQRSLAKAFNIPPENIRVISHFIGGAFGCKGLAWPHVPLTVAAARAVGRPVKLALTRHDMFTNVGYRSPTIQRLQLGAEKDGKLVSVIHSGYSQSPLRDVYAEPFTSPTSVMYATPNLLISQKIVRLHVCRPTFMRAPGEVTGMFALESAMDELAHKLKMDPIDLRLKNYADADPLKGHPFSSKSLKECYRLAAEKFGWHARHAEPGSMRDGSWLVGFGMAGSVYPVNRSAAEVRLVLPTKGKVLAQSATQDLGTGTYTVMSQLVAELLGLPVERVRFEMGESRFPQAPVSGGSQSVSSVGSAVKAAVDDARNKLAQMAMEDSDSPLHGVSPELVTLKGNRLFLTSDPTKGEEWAELLKRHGRESLEVIGAANAKDEKKKYSMYAFGAHFCEVRVHSTIGTVRISRWVCAHACGRILNAKTAESQIKGGTIMGVGMALMEETKIDDRWGRIVTDDLADYHVPVHADIPFFDSYFVEEKEPDANPIGTKGIGEIGITGAAAAVANAVFNATGRRIRNLPITPDKLLI